MAVMPHLASIAGHRPMRARATARLELDDQLRRRTVTFGLAAAVAMPQRPAWAESAKVTFILTNDIYQMGETLMADGKRRGGFARLAAVVKAERAKGGHVVFAHGGDTLSPSLMSGVDQGAHIVALTNAAQAGHLRAGQSRVRFRQGGFSQANGGGEVPGLCRQPDADRTAQPLPGIKDRDIVTFDGVRIGLTGAAHDGTPRMSNPEDLKFLPTVAAMKAQAEALRRDGVDLVVVVMHADRAAGRRAGRDPCGRCDPDRPQPRSLHPVRRPHADGRVRPTTRTMSRSSTCTSRRSSRATGATSNGGRNSAWSTPRR